jgi:hypothetical protein
LTPCPLDRFFYSLGSVVGVKFDGRIAWLIKNMQNGRTWCIPNPMRFTVFYPIRKLEQSRILTDIFNRIRCHKRKSNVTLRQYSTYPTRRTQQTQVGRWFSSLPCESFMKSIGYYRRHQRLRRKLSSNYWSDRFSFVTATCWRVPLFDQVCQIQGPSACANHLSHSACPRLFRSMAGSRAVSIVIASILQRRRGE